MKTSKKKIVVAVGSLEDMAREAIDVWHQAQAGKTPKGGPVEKIYFENEQLLFKTLTQKRCELLKYVHENGKVTIRALAKKLHRDYSNVYQDVKKLHYIGLMLKNENDNQYSVPWKTVVTEIPLCTETSPRHHNHYHYRNGAESDARHHHA